MEKDTLIIIKTDKVTKKKLRRHCLDNDTNMTKLLNKLIKKELSKTEAT